ncbi:ASKHA domain-containing protein [Chloroflexota bacterium]
MGKNHNRKPKNDKNHTVVSPSKQHKPRYVWLNVLPDDLWLKVSQDETIWEALQKTDVKLGGDCGGLGKCGKCKVKIISEIDSPSLDEKEHLDKREMEQGIRLACRTKVNHDLVIAPNEAYTEMEYFKILTTSHHLTNRYIPLSHLDPLVHKRLISLSPEVQKDGLSDLDSIKLGLGPEYEDLKASIHCLRRLPQMLKGNRFRGAAVLHAHYLLDWQNQKEADNGYGLVFDLGTSTLVGKLFSLTDGSELAVTSHLNSQIRYGSDVISRLQYVKDHPKGLERLQYFLIKDLNQITSELLKTAGLHPEEIFIAVAAGNTTMQHFLLGLSPVGIAEAPFSPVLTDGLIVNASDVGFKLHPAALLYTMPMKSGYIGGDLLSVVITSGAAEQEDENILGLDLGTNGEIFLGNGKRLLTCSAAAGPALEGARISAGMIAKAGAIEGVRLEEGQLHYRVIGNIKPKGICGSGLVDLVAVLLRCGLIDDQGRIRHPQKITAKGLNSRIINHGGVNEFLIASAEESYNKQPIYLTQKDVRELQLAKGAIAAGINTLMDELNIGVQDINHIHLAGALGNYIDPDSAIRLGIIPKVNPKIIKPLGNAASTGASMVLLSKGYWEKVNELAGFVEHVELSSRPDFNQYFIEHIDFPKENAW